MSFKIISEIHQCYMQLYLIYLSLFHAVPLSQLIGYKYSHTSFLLHFITECLGWWSLESDWWVARHVNVLQSPEGQWPGYFLTSSFKELSKTIFIKWCYGSVGEAADCDSLSLIPRTYKVERENWISQLVLWPPYRYHGILTPSHK